MEACHDQRKPGLLSQNGGAVRAVGESFMLSPFEEFVFLCHLRASSRLAAACSVLLPESPISEGRANGGSQFFVLPF